MVSTASKVWVYVILSLAVCSLFWQLHLLYHTSSAISFIIEIEKHFQFRFKGAGICSQPSKFSLIKSRRSLSSESQLLEYLYDVICIHLTNTDIRLWRLKAKNSDWQFNGSEWHTTCSHSHNCSCKFELVIFVPWPCGDGGVTLLVMLCYIGHNGNGYMAILMTLRMGEGGTIHVSPSPLTRVRIPKNLSLENAIFG